MLKREGSSFLGLVQEAQNHFRAAHIIPGWIKMRILQGMGDQRANARGCRNNDFEKGREIRQQTQRW